MAVQTKLAFTQVLFIYPHTASIFKNETNCQIPLIAFFFFFLNDLGVLLKIQADTALMLVFATALEH